MSNNSNNKKKELALRQEESMPALTQNQVELIKKTIAAGATDDELKLFIYTANRTGLDPLARQIHFVKRNGKMTIQTAIDGFRVIADRSGQYQGQTKVEYGPNTERVFGKAKKIVPEWAEIGIYKKECQYPISARAYFDEYCPQYPNNFMWQKMPYHMIAKCAESLALRKAFPQDLSGLYTTEELPIEENPEPRKAEIIEVKTSQSQEPQRKAEFTQLDRIKQLCRDLGVTAEKLNEAGAMPKLEDLNYKQAEQAIIQLGKKLAVKSAGAIDPESELSPAPSFSETAEDKEIKDAEIQEESEIDKCSRCARLLSEEEKDYCRHKANKFICKDGAEYKVLCCKCQQELQFV